MLKTTTRLKAPFVRYSSEHLVKLTVIPLRGRNNPHNILAIPAKAVKIGREAK
jgi:hypothetical protein